MYLLSKKKKLKIILTQLPFRFYNLEFTKKRNNIPLAAGFLKAMAWKEGLLKDTDIEILNPLAADITSDSMLIEMFISKKPDVIGFSLYLWNLTRSLYVIKEIKKCLPKTIIVVGGPEVTQEFNYISPQGADFSFIGEGEVSFVQLIKHLLGNQPSLESISNLIFIKEDKIICNPYFETITDINDIPSPFLSGCLDPRLYRKYWLETMRWCPYRCKYCLYYYRSRIRNPFYSLERIEDELNYAKKLGLKYIDLHDSAFNLNPKFREICGIIQRVNKDKKTQVSLFLEAELLNVEDVELLSSLNISWAEIGLQSINPETLNKIERNVDLGQWLKGINLLRKKNINIMIDIMVGLPGDDLNSILKTIQFLKKNKLDSCSIPATLSVGPATTIRREAKKLGIVKFQSQAPHFILETKHMSFSDIKKARNLITLHLMRKLPRDNMFSPYHDGLPLLHNHHWAKYPYSPSEKVDSKSDEGYPKGIPITKIIINLDSQAQDVNYFRELGSRLEDKIANNLIIWISMANLSACQLKIITEFLKYLSKANPYNIWNIILEGCPPLSAQEELAVKQSISYLPNNLDFREIYMKKEPGKKEFYRVSTKLFYILPPLNALREKAITPKVEENRKVFRNLYIDISTDLPNTIQNLCVGKKEGILVNFDQKVRPQMTIEALRLLKNRKDAFTPIRFKNLLFQKIWHKFFNTYAIDSIVNDDLILNIDTNKEERFSYLSHKRIMLDMTEFILSLKKDLPSKYKLRNIHT